MALNIKNNINKGTNQFSDFFKNWLNLNRWVIVLYLIVLAAAAVLYVGNVNDTTELLNENRSLERKIDDLKNRKKIYDSKVKKLQSPDRIIPIATDRLGMVLAEEAPLYIEDRKKEEEEN